MYRNVTLNTRKIAIPAARCAADDAIIMTYVNTLAFGINIHNNGLLGEGEIHLADICTP